MIRWVLWLVVAGGVGTGFGSGLVSCSIYHKARADLPPDGLERIALRIRQAGDIAAEAAADIQHTADDLAARPPRLTMSEAGGIVQSWGWELARRADSVRDAITKTGADLPASGVFLAAADRAVVRLDASATALNRGLPEGPGSLTDCREALDAVAAAAAEAVKAIRAENN